MSNDPDPSRKPENVASDYRDVKAMVFTDLVDSTKLHQELGDVKAQHLINQHYRMVCSMVRSSKEAKIIGTQGDSILLSFTTPSEAVTFALQLQVRLRQLSKKAGRQLQERIGIHVGEILQHTEGGTEKADLRGIQVAACARVMSLAGPGQILLTRFAYDNARQTLQEETIAGIGTPGWTVHGLYALKGITEPVEICEVVVAELTESQAPADSEKARRIRDERPPALEVRQAVIRKMPYLQRLKAATAPERRQAWAGAAIAALVGLVLLFTGWLDVLSYDLSYGLRRGASPQTYTNEVEIVVMDDESKNQLNQSYLREWDRRLHAQLLTHLDLYGARAVVFDVVFPTNRPAEDPEFIQAIRRHGRVAVAADMQWQVEEGGYRTIKIVEPFEQLRTHAWSGLTESAKMASLAIRRPRYALPWDASIGPSKSLAETVVARIDTPPKTSPLGAWLNYYCPPDRIPVRSYYQVLSNTIPASVFSNKVVFVGSKIELRNPDEPGSDHFQTPYNLWGFPAALGVTINATSYLNLKRGDWFVRLSPWLECLAVLVAGMISGYLLFFLPPPAAVLGGFIAVLLAMLCLVLQLLISRYWFPWLIIAFGQIPVAVIWSALLNSRRIMQNHG